MSPVEQQFVDALSEARADLYVQSWQGRVSALLVRVGHLTLSNVTAVTAGGALGLYLTGLVRHFAQLQSLDVPAVRALPLMSLQEYFLEGVAVVFPVAAPVLALALFACLVWVVWGPHILEALWEATQPLNGDPVEDMSRTEGDVGKGAALAARFHVRRLFWGLAIGCTGLFLPMESWPLIVALALGYKACAFVLREKRRHPGWRRGRALTLTVLLSYVLVLLSGYFLPTPLQRACVVPVKGDRLSGYLLAQANGAVYLTPERSQGGGTEIQVIPLAKIKSLRLLPGLPIQTRTFMERYVKPHFGFAAPNLLKDLYPRPPGCFPAVARGYRAPFRVVGAGNEGLDSSIG